MKPNVCSYMWRHSDTHSTAIRGHAHSNERGVAVGLCPNTFHYLFIAPAALTELDHQRRVRMAGCEGETVRDICSVIDSEIFFEAWFQPVCQWASFRSKEEKPLFLLDFRPVSTGRNQLFDERILTSLVVK